MPDRKEKTLPSACCLHFPWYNPVCHQPSLPQRQNLVMRTSRSFLQKLLSNQLACTVVWVYTGTGYGISLSLLLNFMRFLPGHFSMLSRSIRIAAPASSVSTTPDHQFGAIWKLAERVRHSIIWVKNKSVSTIVSWDMSLVTKHQLDFVPLFTILWAWQFRQFSTPFILHLCRCHQSGYITILWEIML